MKSPFDSITVGPMTLRNRFIKSGANEGMSRNGIPTKAMLKHHGDLARGGIGLTTVAYGAVNEVGRTSTGVAVLYSKFSIANAPSTYISTVGLAEL